VENNIMATTKKVAKKKVVKKAAPKTRRHRVRSKGPQRLRAGLQFTDQEQEYELTATQLKAVQADPELIIS
jgi:hypothetical protein